MKSDKNDRATRLAQEIIQFAKDHNMNVRKKRRPPITVAPKKS